MAIELGTRIKTTASQTHSPTGDLTRGVSRDPGLAKLVTAGMMFGGGAVSAPNGTFAAFTAGDPVRVLGTALNNGEFLITGIDATNHAFLSLDPPPKAEGTVTATVRTP